jgi:hypothetical protein
VPRFSQGDSSPDEDRGALASLIFAPGNPKIQPDFRPGTTTDRDRRPQNRSGGAAKVSGQSLVMKRDGWMSMTLSVKPCSFEDTMSW